MLETMTLGAAVLLGYAGASVLSSVAGWPMVTAALAGASVVFAVAAAWDLPRLPRRRRWLVLAAFTGATPFGMALARHLGAGSAALFALAVISAVRLILPTVDAVRDAESQRRLRLGLCAACGYDLRGTPGGPCPECGAARPAER